MSASSKKKLRAEQNSAKLTEKQLEAQKEAKQNKLYTTLFVVVLAILVVVAAYAGITQRIAGSGVHERNTVAVTVGDHQLSNAELNYFYIDAVNNFYSQNGSYAAFYGLDVSKPLDKQYISEEEGLTWADNFVSTAEQNARAVYALADEAAANGFALDAAQQEQVDTISYNLASYAMMSGFSDAASYLKAYYGNGASVESFQEYFRLNLLAEAYREHYTESLTYSNDQIRAKEAENFNKYSSYDYNQYYLATNKYLSEGTVGEDGTTTYTDEQRSEAAKAAEADAKILTSDEITDTAALDRAIAALSVNADTDAASTALTNQLYTSVNSRIIDWVSDSSRQAGDKTYVASTTTSTDENGKETTVTNGYYIVFFNGSSDNAFPMVNVRHILTGFEGGTADSNGVTVYTDEEKAAAKSSAEAILAEWKSGEHTENSFAALASEKTTDPGSKQNGGLYEDVYPGQMVSAFNDWCFDSARKAGDTGIVETNYGYHVMYFVGNSDSTYRDKLISDELRDAEFNDWYTELVDSMPLTEGNTNYIRTDIVLNANGK